MFLIHDSQPVFFVLVVIFVMNFIQTKDMLSVCTVYFLLDLEGKDSLNKDVSYKCNWI